jgi:hypothetical protein
LYGVTIAQKAVQTTPTSFKNAVSKQNGTVLNEQKQLPAEALGTFPSKPWIFILSYVLEDTV